MPYAWGLCKREITALFIKMKINPAVLSALLFDLTQTDAPRRRAVELPDGVKALTQGCLGLQRLRQELATRGRQFQPPPRCAGTVGHLVALLAPRPAGARLHGCRPTVRQPRAMIPLAQRPKRPEEISNPSSGTIVNHIGAIVEIGGENLIRYSLGNRTKRRNAMTATLTAWSISRYGAPEVLTPVTRAIPTPGPTKIQIQIRASAVTRADGMMRAGTPRFACLFLGLRRPRQNLSGTGLSGRRYRGWRQGQPVCGGRCRVR